MTDRFILLRQRVYFRGALTLLLANNFENRTTFLQPGNRQNLYLQQ